MFLAPTPFGNTVLEPDVLKADKKNCRKAGPCGVGSKALYLNSFYISRRFYVVYSDIRRVYKRIAMSSGGFTGRGMFGTMPYLVVELKDGRVRQCNFRCEEQVDTILKWVAEEHREIPIVTEKAERSAKKKGEIRPVSLRKETKREIELLRGDLDYLERKPEIGQKLTASVRKKRTVDQMPMRSIILVCAVALLGLSGILSGLFLMAGGKPYAPYLLLFGGAFLFMTLAAGTLPVGGNSKRAAERRWESALAESADYISGKPGFFLPPQYAHPVICRRMIRAMESGRASDRREALEIVKSDLAAMNSDVKVSQEEYDEVVQVKPLFLECGYQDRI